MIRNAIFFIIFINMATTSVFAQLKEFTIEVPIPPIFEIPDSIQSFTIMNRSMTSEFQNYDERELQVDFYKKNFNTNYVLLDSLAADTTIKVLGDVLFNSQRFDVVIPLDRNIYRLLPYNKTPQALDWEYVANICETYNTDALVVLENLAIRTVTNYMTGEERDLTLIYKYHYATMDFYSMAHWRIYEPNSQKILVDAIMNQDTLYWAAFDYDIKNLFKQIPTVKGASTETAIKIALDFSDVIAPKWERAIRFYYILKDKQIDQSVELAAEGKWDEALENWLKFAESGNRSNQSKLMLNIALGNEMTGNIEDAILWAKKSQQLYYREVTNHYLKELLKRQAILNN